MNKLEFTTYLGKRIGIVLENSQTIVGTVEGVDDYGFTITPTENTQYSERFNHLYFSWVNPRVQYIGLDLRGDSSRQAKLA